MKKILIIFSLLVFCGTVGFGQSWLWGRQGILKTTGDGSEGWSVATDPSGNAYLVGEYSGDTLIFGPDTLIYLRGYFETYLIKYSPSGNVLWVKQSSTPNTPNCYGYGYSVAIDKSDNPLITGFFEDTISFGAYTLSASRKNEGNVFLTKYDSNGNVLWARQSNVPSNRSSGSGQSVCTDKNNNSYITGYFEDTISFGAFQLRQKYKYTGGIFITKYDSNGNLQWAKQAVDSSETANGAAAGIASDTKGNIYITGHFNDTTYFGSYKLSTANSYYDNGDVFLVKYNSFGNVLWATQATLASSNSYGIGYGVTTDKLGYIYLTGTFRDTITIGSNKLFAYSSYNNLFVAKFDSNGNNIWAESATELDSSIWVGYTVSIDTNENLYLSAGGYSQNGYNYRIAFGSDTFRTYIGPNFGDDGASLVLKLDTCGELFCGSIVPGGGDDNNGIAVDPSGNDVYFGGDLLNQVVFGSDTLTNPQYHEVPFMAKWTAPCHNSGCTIESSVKSIPNKPSITLFPNPSTGLFTIQSSVNSGQLSVEIYNVLGEKVLTKPLLSAQGANLINMSGQPGGVYFYRVLNESSALVGEGKFVME
jgi:hypothetical protein